MASFTNLVIVVIHCSLTDSTLVTVDYQCFLPLCLLNLLTWPARGTAACYVIACNRHYILVVTQDMYTSAGVGKIDDDQAIDDN